YTHIMDTTTTSTTTTEVAQSPDVLITTTTQQQWPAVKPLERPLMFAFQMEDPQPIKYPCLRCDFVVFDSRAILEHLLQEHKLVIGDVNSVANLSSYLEHWRNVMRGKPIEDYTTSINDKHTDKPDEMYYLLSDILPEDQELRRMLQTERLIFILEQQHRERSDQHFSSVCPMCPVEFRGDRAAVSTHMFETHNFNIGLPDNLVNINELLDLLRTKYDANQCLFCEKTFKSQVVLKMHMKKKKHCRLNPNNTEYDRFYLLNYMEPGKNWEELKKEEEEDSSGEQTPNNLDLVKQVESEGHVSTQWDDWTEDKDEDQEETVVCLFCPNEFDGADLVFQHMVNVHNFDFHVIRKEWKLDYYDTIKMLNFIRRHQYEMNCCHCGSAFESDDSLEKHQKDAGHCGVMRQLDIWRDAQYLLPTYENDSLLRSFEDFDDNEDKEYECSEQQYREELLGSLKQERDEVLVRLGDVNLR
ncbi:hypothetical protein SAMD00019534_053410, partial [Acytostelium subglobosum LB1]|uniref:hypothetical protein n=1 Tax=Acytostelium subglobosum LB1 TaxID=1410327 RepID=UPI000644A9AB